MIDNRRELLTYDISSFKSSTKKLRNSHISLFKVALRSFERGDFDTAFELFNKLSSDTFLPIEARNKVMQNKKDIEIIIEKGISDEDKKEIDPEFLEKLERKRKKESSSIEKIPYDEEPSQTEKEIKEKVEDGNFYPIIKTAMATFAEKLASTLGEVINGKLVKKESQKNKSEENLKSLDEIDVEQDVDISTQPLDSFTKVDTEGSVQDIYKKEFKSDLSDYEPKKELSEKDIQRFLNIGTQLSKTVPEFMDSVNDMKESLDNLTQGVPEINELNKRIKESLEQIQESNKTENLEKLHEDLSDDLDIIEKMKKEDQLRQSDIFKEDIPELSPKEEITQDKDDLIDRLTKKYQQIDDRLKHIESAEFQRQSLEELEKLYSTEDSKKTNKELQNSLLDDISKKFESLNSRVEELKEEAEETKKAKEEWEKLSDKIKSNLEKEFSDYNAESLEENLNQLETSLDKGTETEEYEKDKDIYTHLEDKYQSIDEQLKQLQLNEEEILSQFGIDKEKLEEKKKKKLSEKLKQAHEEKTSKEKLEDYLTDDLENIGESIPLSNISEDELNRILTENIETEEDIKESVSKEDIEKQPQEEYTNDLKHKLKEQLEKEKEQELYERNEDESSFIRDNASEISRMLRNKLQSTSNLYDDSQYDINEIVKDLNLKEDTYDQQMPPVNEQDIELPAGEENKYTKMDPIQIDGNLQKLMRITLSAKSNKYVDKLIDIENQISELMESSDKEEFEDLATKYDKIKTQERLEKISKDIEKEMVINYSSDTEPIQEETPPEEKKTATQEKSEEPPYEEIPSEEEIPQFSENMLPLTKKFYTNQETLANILDKLSDVLENSFNRLMQQTTKEREEYKEQPEEEYKTKEKEPPTESKTEEKPKHKDKAKPEEEKEEEEDYAFIAKEEEVKKKGKEEPKFKEKEEEEDEEFVAKEEIVYKKEPKKVIPQELLEEQIQEQERKKEDQIESYPDLSPLKDKIEDKEFVSLNDALTEESLTGEEYTLEDLEKEERLQHTKIPGVDNNFMPGAYIPLDEYKNDDGFFTDIEGNPILLPEEEEIPEEEEEDFIEEDEFSIERPPEDEEEDEEVFDVPEELHKEKKKIEPLKLTFNFKDMFHNKTYLKYRDILNEAAQLVSEKKLDQALEYYRVILDQNIPKAFKLMIQQNIDDITKTIIDTFKRSDTIVNVKSSGEITRIKTKYIKEKEEEEESNEE